MPAQETAALEIPGKLPEPTAGGKQRIQPRHAKTAVAELFKSVLGNAHRGGSCRYDAMIVQCDVGRRKPALEIKA